MNRRLWWATLCSSSPRYETWRGILGSDDVPLKSPDLGMTQLGSETAEVYLLDLNKLTAEQYGRLVDWIVGRFREPREEVLNELRNEGFPIRAADVFVAFDLRAFV